MKFETVTIDHSTVIQKEGMQIEGYIAGVNSGVYKLPFVIRVRTWAKKWWFRKFFVQTMELNIYEVRLLHAELSKCIDWYEQSHKTIN